MINSVIVELSTPSIMTCAKWLISYRPLFFIGSGLSLACGYPSARKLADRIVKALPKSIYRDIGVREKDLRKMDLGQVTQIARTIVGWTEQYLLEVLFGKSNSPYLREPWLTLDECIERYRGFAPLISPSVPHLVIARLAREGLISELFSTNYDCMLELACWATGMDPVTDSKETVGCEYPRRYFRVLVPENVDTIVPRPSVMHITKVHGGIDNALENGQWAKERTLALAWEHLVKWPSPPWVQHLLKSKMRSSAVALTGFSGGDPYLFAEMLEAFGSQEYREPRVIVIDPSPSVLLRRLVCDHKIEGCLPVFDRPQCDECRGRKWCSYRCSNGSRAESKMEGFYLHLYASVVIEIMTSNLATAGLAVMSRLFGLSDRAAYGMLDEVASLLQELLGTAHIRNNHIVDILFYFLPRVVSNSVVLLGPLGSAPQEEESERAIERAGYYYPLLADLSVAYAAMVLISRLIKTLPKDLELRFKRDGTIDIGRTSAGTSVSLAPILATRTRTAMAPDERSRATMIRSRFFRLYPRDPFLRPIIVEPPDPHRSHITGSQDSTTYHDIGRWVSHLLSEGGHRDAC